jgi:hypothetical protein
MLNKISILILIACLYFDNSYSQLILMNGPYKVTMQPSNNNFEDASLSLTSPMTDYITKPDSVSFNFDLANYTLGNQTSDAASKNCANSAKGQHIHFILDNKPYEALYKPNYKTFLSEGKHLLLAFLSRSYHESIKQPKAYIIKQITVGKSTMPDYDLTKPMLFYSRPKGIYLGADTANVLIDFYVVNAVISAKNYKIKLTVNGIDFMLTQWQPFLIQGLPMGVSTIKLQLVNKKGEPVEGPFNIVERKITLAASEPIKQ